MPPPQQPSQPPGQPAQPGQPHVTVEQAVSIAIGHYQANNFPEAESIARQVLAVAPNHVDALHLIGLIAHRVGRNDIAVQVLTQIAQQNPQRTDVLNNLGEVYRALQMADEAVAAYSAAIAG